MTIPAADAPIGATIRWTDTRGGIHIGRVVAWENRPEHAYGVRIVETITTEMPHIIPEKREVEVLEASLNEHGDTDAN